MVEVDGHGAWSSSTIAMKCRKQGDRRKTSLLRQIVSRVYIPTTAATYLAAFVLNLSWPRGLLHLSKQGGLAKVFDNFYTAIYLDITRSHPFTLTLRTLRLFSNNSSSIVPTARRIRNLEFKHSIFHRRPSTLFNSSSTESALASNMASPLNLARSTLLTVVVKGQRSHSLRG